MSYPPVRVKPSALVLGSKRAERRRAAERKQMDEMDAIAFPTAEAAAGLADPMSQWDDVKAVAHANRILIDGSGDEEDEAAGMMWDLMDGYAPHLPKRRMVE